MPFANFIRCASCNKYLPVKYEIGAAKCRCRTKPAVCDNCCKLPENTQNCFWCKHPIKRVLGIRKKTSLLEYDRFGHVGTVGTRSMIHKNMSTRAVLSRKVMTNWTFFTMVRSLQPTLFKDWISRQKISPILPGNQAIEGGSSEQKSLFIRTTWTRKLMAKMTKIDSFRESYTSPRQCTYQRKVTCAVLNRLFAVIAYLHQISLDMM